MKNILAGLLMLTASSAMAQNNVPDSITTKENPVTPLTFSGYIEGYYSYDLNRPVNNTKPGFLYNYTRHNEFNLNLGFVKAAYAKDRVRANVALAVGTYMNANYAAEPGTLKNIYEANAGYKLSVKKNVWLDIGIMPSHIGFESATGKDNWNLTRSMLAENSPYFESGARLSYTSNNGKLTLAALALNGWQRITRVEGNSLMSYGTQVYYKPTSKVTLNWSTFVGTDKPDSTRQWRYFNNLYGIFQLCSTVGLITGFDIGTEQSAKRSNKMNVWCSPVAILRVMPTDKWAFGLRGEYYNDKQGVIITTGTPNGFKTGSASLNIDYLPMNNVALRLESRSFFSRDAIFVKGNTPTSRNSAITFSTAVSF